MLTSDRTLYHSFAFTIASTVILRHLPTFPLEKNEVYVHSRSTELKAGIIAITIIHISLIPQTPGRSVNAESVKL